MNTDVNFLTTMMDILTGPIPAAIADEVEGKKLKRLSIIFFFPFWFWTERVRGRSCVPL